MTTNLEKRIQTLEAQIKSAVDSPVWVDGHNSQVRIDINGRRGETLTFPTAREAASWLESVINRHPQAAGSYGVDRLWELYRNPDQLRDTIKAAIGDTPIDVHGMKYGAVDFYGSLFGNLKTAGPADLKLWLLATALEYFNTREFKARFEAQQTNDTDERMFATCYAFFAWERPGATVGDFWRLVIQATGLQPVETA